MTLQIIASEKWMLHIMDVEGAFLQGEELKRAGGRIFARVPREGIPGVDPSSVIELCKCVYGLMDAPRKWWENLTKTLTQTLNMKQGELDRCIFFWYDDKVENKVSFTFGSTERLKAQDAPFLFRGFGGAFLASGHGSGTN